MELTHISLFAGIGGIDIAAEWAGFRTILFVEIDPFCQKVLNKHWPDVPIIGDIKDATREKIMAYAEGRRCQRGRQNEMGEGRKVANGFKGGSEPEWRYRESTAINPITLITGGFPCQPVSQAGKRKGEADHRWLWPDMLRVISEVRPAWVVAENVTGLLTMGFYDCLSDLEGAGYETISFVIPACGVNAPHRRDRIFIVGYTEHTRWDGSEVTGGFGEGGNGRNGEEGQESPRQLEGSDSSSRGAEDVADAEQQRQVQCPSGGNGEQTRHREGVSKGGSEIATDTEGEGLERANAEGAAQTRGCPAECLGGNWWAAEPELGRVAYGVPSRVDRLKCLGNAVVPQQIYPILQAIASIENTIHITPKC